MIRTKRIYTPASADDGCRVLVDRVWPRGVPKNKARLDRWFKDIGPSIGLRRWFAHDPRKWETFEQAYHDELAAKQESVDWLVAEARKGTLTLVFAARDEHYNNAVALKHYLEALLEADDSMPHYG